MGEVKEEVPAFAGMTASALRPAATPLMKGFAGDESLIQFTT
jgi:hypothetical protein